MKCSSPGSDQYVQKTQSLPDFNNKGATASKAKTKKQKVEDNQISLSKHNLKKKYLHKETKMLNFFFLGGGLIYV